MMRLVLCPEKWRTPLWRKRSVSVRDPGVTKPNQVCNRPVSLLDIYPTLCERAGLQTPGTVEFKSLNKVLDDDEAVVAAVAQEIAGAVQAWLAAQLQLDPGADLLAQHGGHGQRHLPGRAD